MNSRLIPILILICLVPLPAFALDAQTDKTDYLRNESITITGTIVPSNATDTISVWILQKNIWYDRADIQVSGENFTATFTTDLLTNDGTYVARVDYNGEEFKIPFSISTPVAQIAEPIIEESVIEEQIIPVEETPEVDPIVIEPETEEIEETIDEPIINATQPIVNATIPEPITNSTQVKEIPGWIKGVFVFWSEGGISDSELLEAIRFLVNTGVLVL